MRPLALHAMTPRQQTDLRFLAGIVLSVAVLVVFIISIHLAL